MSLWNKEDCARLLEMREKKVPFDEIASILGRTPMACHLKHTLLVKRGDKYRGRGWNNRDTETLLEMVHSGCDWDLIAKTMRRSVMACKMKLHYIEKVEGSEAKQKLRREWSDADTMTLHRMCRAGARFKKISETLGRSVTACRKRWLITNHMKMVGEPEEVSTPPTEPGEEEDEEEEEPMPNLGEIYSDIDKGWTMVSSPLPDPSVGRIQLTSALDVFSSKTSEDGRLDALYKFKEYLGRMPQGMESWASTQMDICDHLIQAILLSMQPPTLM